MRPLSVFLTNAAVNVLDDVLNACRLVAGGRARMITLLLLLLKYIYQSMLKEKDRTLEQKEGNRNRNKQIYKKQTQQQKKGSIQTCVTTGWFGSKDWDERHRLFGGHAAAECKYWHATVCRSQIRGPSVVSGAEGSKKPNVRNHPRVILNPTCRVDFWSPILSSMIFLDSSRG